jgi:hypothetical protein
MDKLFTPILNCKKFKTIGPDSRLENKFENKKKKRDKDLRRSEGKKN